MTSDHATHGGGLVRRFLVALVGTVCRFPRTVLLISLALCALSIAAAATRLQYHTQRNDLISADKDYQQRWRRYLDEFGDDDDVVVVVRGTDRERMKAALEVVAAKIKEKPELFDRLFYKADLRHLRDRALLLLPEAELDTIHQHITNGEMSILLSISALWRTVGLEGMLLEARGRLTSLQAGQPMSTDDVQFFTQL